MTPPPPAESPNAAQVEYWNSAAGATWAKYHALLDEQIAPLGAAGLEALAPQPGERVVDVGCGCGQTTLELAARVGPAGRVLGLDVSQRMLAVARARVPGDLAARIEFREADAQTADFGERAWQAVYSRFGVMFFADPAAAFARLRGALAPAGRLAFVCWRPLAENPWMSEPLAAARPVLGAPVPADPYAPGPFAFADAARVRTLLTTAGYVDVQTRAVDAAIGVSTLEDALSLALRVGPLGAALRENPACKEALEAPVRDVLARHLTPAGVRMAAAIWVVTARRPAH